MRVVSLQARLVALDATLKLAQDDLGLPRLVLLELEHAMALAAAELGWVRSIDQRHGDGRPRLERGAASRPFRDDARR